MNSMSYWIFFIAEKGPLIEKTIRSKPDITPICSNATDRLIILIRCKIHTERSGKDCTLRYRHGRESVQDCDPRFKLMTKNQTVFLHLSSLTPVDSGIHTCECSHEDGTEFLRLNITVEGKCLIYSHALMIQTHSFLTYIQLKKVQKQYI